MGFRQWINTAMHTQKRLSVAPFVPTANISPQENYAGYTALPNLPMGTAGDYTPNQFRLHAPFVIEREREFLVTNAGKHFFDAGDETVIRIPDQPLQQHFNQKRVLEPQIVLAPDNGVIVPQAVYKAGFMQQFIPSDCMMHHPISGASPAVPLSVPIQNGPRTLETNKRAPISGAKAHPIPRGR
jgi:hypothetical protein